MTRNQIEYQKLREQMRSNLANEQLTRVRDSGTLELRGKELDESRRHNMVGEGINRDTLTETQRHNQAVEKNAAADLGIRSATLEETKRSNLAKEQETNRSNIAREKETNRANMAMESEKVKQRLTDAELKRQGLGIEAQKATSGLLSASAASKQAEVAENRFLIDKNKMDSEVQLNLARIGELAAHEDYLKLQSLYLDDENARAWINSIASGLRDTMQAGKTLSEAIKQFAGLSNSLGAWKALSLFAK